MQTPTTTTRENSGALAMMPSIIPGTPTHSKMTGRFGVARQLLRQPAKGATTQPQPLQSFDRADCEVERVEDALQVSVSLSKAGGYRIR